MKNEYLVIIYDCSGIYLFKSQAYITSGDNYDLVEKDVYSRLDNTEIEAFDIIIIPKQDLIPLTELPIINKEKKQ